MSAKRPLSRKSSILVGIACAAVGVAIVLVSFFAAPEKFQAPRWVVACAGGAFLFFGGWIAAVYLLGYDPKLSDETLPPPLVQLAVFVPGMLCLVAPIHWVASVPARDNSRRRSRFRFSRCTKPAARWEDASSSASAPC